MTQTISMLRPGDIVAIRALDDIPEHLFKIQTIEDGYLTGMALSGPLQGCYGEPDMSLVLRIQRPPLGSS